jgi:hypothetical protein
MKLPAAVEPTIWNTRVNGLVAEDLVLRFGVKYETSRPISRTEMT